MATEGSDPTKRPLNRTTTAWLLHRGHSPRVRPPTVPMSRAKPCKIHRQNVLGDLTGATAGTMWERTRNGLVNEREHGRPGFAVIADRTGEGRHHPDSPGMVSPGLLSAGCGFESHGAHSLPVISRTACPDRRLWGRMWDECESCQLFSTSASVGGRSGLSASIAARFANVLADGRSSRHSLRSDRAAWRPSSGGCAS